MRLGKGREDRGAFGSGSSMQKVHKMPGDLATYRKGYPGWDIDNPRENSNIRFYKGLKRCVPDGLTIDEIHEQWAGDYRGLEVRHGYIQWLFPIHEDGMNIDAQVLQRHEARAMMEDVDVMERIRKSYEMMLDFYGAEIADWKTGTLRNPRGLYFDNSRTTLLLINIGGISTRTYNHNDDMRRRAAHYKNRFKNLSERSHNFLRITRILKFLGEVGLEYLKVPFLTFWIRELLVEGTVGGFRDSLSNYWVFTLRSDDDLTNVLRFLQNPKSQPPLSVLRPGAKQTQESAVGGGGDAAEVSKQKLSGAGDADARVAAQRRARDDDDDDDDALCDDTGGDSARISASVGAIGGSRQQRSHGHKAAASTKPRANPADENEDDELDDEKLLLLAGIPEKMTTRQMTPDRKFNNNGKADSDVGGPGQRKGAESTLLSALEGAGTVPQQPGSAAKRASKDLFSPQRSRPASGDTGEGAHEQSPLGQGADEAPQRAEKKLKQLRLDSFFGGSGKGGASGGSRGDELDPDLKDL